MQDVDPYKLEQLAKIFRHDDKTPEYELARIYLQASRESLIQQTLINEGMFGEEVWMACEALRVRNEETPISKWLLGDRKTPCPSRAKVATNNSVTQT